jgi:catechol 2,3-dioxygenase-like lactoylglutathione lyase family enzyme
MYFDISRNIVNIRNINRSNVRRNKMSRVHIALNTNHFEESVEFYSVLFDQAPAKLKPDWAKFDVAEPALNLTLNRRASNSDAPEAMLGQVNHLGIEVPDSASVAAANQRLIDSGLKTLEEDDVTCCYARQDKTWVTDPNGHSWEFFFVKD